MGHAWSCQSFPLSGDMLHSCTGVARAADVPTAACAHVQDQPGWLDTFSALPRGDLLPGWQRRSRSHLPFLLSRTGSTGSTGSAGAAAAGCGCGTRRCKRSSCSSSPRHAAHLHSTLAASQGAQGRCKTASSATEHCRGCYVAHFGPRAALHSRRARSGGGLGRSSPCGRLSRLLCRVPASTLPAGAHQAALHSQARQQTARTALHCTKDCTAVRPAQRTHPATGMWASDGVRAAVELTGRACIASAVGGGAPKLVGALPVHAVDPALIEVDQEDEVVPEHAQAVQRGHLHAHRCVSGRSYPSSQPSRMQDLATSLNGMQL